MKKILFLSVFAIFVTLAAGAQNKAIDELVAKYSNREGFMVINVNSDVLKIVGVEKEILGIDAEIEGVDTITIVVGQNDNTEFVDNVKRALATMKYTPIMSLSEEGSRVEIMATDLGKRNGKPFKEIIITLRDKEEFLLIRVIGDGDPKTLAALLEAM